jgi:hypothetical protein
LRLRAEQPAREEETDGLTFENVLCLVGLVVRSPANKGISALGDFGPGSAKIAILVIDYVSLQNRDRIVESILELIRPSLQGPPVSKITPTKNYIKLRTLEKYYIIYKS